MLIIVKKTRVKNIEEILKFLYLRGKILLLVCVRRRGFSSTSEIGKNYKCKHKNDITNRSCSKLTFHVV